MKSMKKFEAVSGKGPANRHGSLWVGLGMVLVVLSCATVPPTDFQAMRGLELAQFEATQKGEVRRIPGFTSDHVKTRNLYVYLPFGYESNDLAYPVIYFQDGNNLFSSASSVSGNQNWNLDRVLDVMIENEMIPPVIVVGIGNTSARADEYLPYDLGENPRFPGQKAEGENYLRFLLEELVPWSEASFRIASGPTNTLIAGSSFGGMISLYAGLKNPQIFGTVLAFSPSLWVADEKILVDFSEEEPTAQQNFYGSMGGEEAEGVDPTYFQDQLNRFQEVLSQRVGSDSVLAFFDPKGTHSASVWTDQLVQALQWGLRESK